VRDGRKVSGVLTTTCENAKVQFTVTFDAYNGLESITAVNLTKEEEENTSLSQLMANAGINTLMGMGTVFVMLIIIAYIISLFKYIPKLMDKRSGKPKEIVAPAPQPSPKPAAVPVVEEDLSDDEELVAVISAAVAAYEGEAGIDGFVVRSIRRHSSSAEKI
jgi:sodium pump decarboxylase gamma subunit